MFIKVNITDKLRKDDLMALLFIFFSILNMNHCYAVSVGDSYGGGTVFCVSQTADITQCVTGGSGNYGLIIANTDQVNYYSNSNHGVTWSSTLSTTGATSDDNGASNTATIIAAYPSDNQSNNAAWAAHIYVDPTEGHTDWYLPSKNELNKMYLYAYANNLIGTGCTGSRVGGVQCLVGGWGSCSDCYLPVYWSSSESPSRNTLAWNQDFSLGGHNDYYHKFLYIGVRAIRAFNNPTTNDPTSDNSAINEVFSWIVPVVVGGAVGAAGATAANYYLYKHGLLCYKNHCENQAISGKSETLETQMENVVAKPFAPHGSELPPSYIKYSSTN